MGQLGLFIAGAVVATAANTALFTAMSYSIDGTRNKKLSSAHMMGGAAGALLVDTLCIAPILTYAAMGEALRQRAL